MLLEPGRVCLKTAGREGGKYCVVVEEPKDGFVNVSGPKSITRIKRRKCNVLHLEPTEHKFDGKLDDSGLEESWNKSGLLEKLNIQVPKKRVKNEKVAPKKQ